MAIGTGTKGPTGAGIQHTARGPVQGVRLVAPQGLPIDVIVDGNGKLRLAVDANISIASATVNVDLDSDTDNVAIRNTANDDELLIYPDGTIKIRLTDESGVAFSAANPLPIDIINGNLDVELDAADGDNIAIHDDEGDELEINADGSINVKIASSSPGTVSDASSEDTGDGLVALTGSAAIIVSISIPAGTTYHLTEWDWNADRSCTFRLEVRDGVTLVRIIRSTQNTGSMPGDTIVFPSPVPITGAATRVIQMTATRTAGSNGNASGGINGYTT